jgi:hypothetical protein
MAIQDTYQMGLNCGNAPDLFDDGRAPREAALRSVTMARCIAPQRFYIPTNLPPFVENCNAAAIKVGDGFKKAQAPLSKKKRKTFTSDQGNWKGEYRRPGSRWQAKAILSQWWTDQIQRWPGMKYRPILPCVLQMKQMLPES